MIESFNDELANFMRSWGLEPVEMEGYDPYQPVFMNETVAVRCQILLDQ